METSVYVMKNIELRYKHFALVYTSQTEEIRFDTSESIGQDFFTPELKQQFLKAAHIKCFDQR